MAKRLFVGNLPFTATVEELRTLFTPYGVTDISIPKDRQNGDRPKGFAFVDVEDDQAQAAIDALHGKEFGGRALNINEARPREDRPRSGGGYQGGGYNGGNRDSSGYGSSSGSYGSQF
jgi:cold-inducible RNA-binding protein